MHLLPLLELDLTRQMDPKTNNSKQPAVTQIAPLAPTPCLFQFHHRRFRVPICSPSSPLSLVPDDLPIQPYRPGLLRSPARPAHAAARHLRPSHGFLHCLGGLQKVNEICMICQSHLICKVLVPTKKSATSHLICSLLSFRIQLQQSNINFKTLAPTNCWDSPIGDGRTGFFPDASHDMCGAHTAFCAKHA